MTDAGGPGGRLRNILAVALGVVRKSYIEIRVQGKSRAHEQKCKAQEAEREWEEAS
jgi:hypothetical protein